MHSMADRVENSRRSPGPGAERTCVGCGARAESDALVRLVVLDDPAAEPASPTRRAAPLVVVDAKGGAFGRGAHVHPERACIEGACKRGLARVFRRELHPDPAVLTAEIARAFARRLEGLLTGGRRAGIVAVGTDAVVEAYRAGRVSLVLLAADATAAASRGEVEQATRRGMTLVYGDKLVLARAIGRTDIRGTSADDGIAICAVTNRALASAIRRAWLCAAGLVPVVAVATSPKGEERPSRRVEDR